MAQGEDGAAAYLDEALRRVWTVDGLDPAAARPVDAAGVIGAGTMGAGIAVALLSADIAVTLVEARPDALDRGVATIRAAFARAVAKGRMDEAAAAARLARLTPAAAIDGLAAAALVVEAVYEDMALKQRLFAALDRVARTDAVLATNTSYLDVDAIAAATARPHDVLGLHFFAPANVMPALEVVRGRATGAAALATAMAVARRLGKTPAVARNGPGFIGNRMLARRQAAAQRMVLEGAGPAAIDAVHLRFGMPMGPLQMSDLSGLDIGWHRDPDRVETLRDALCAAGRLGQKAGAGWYDYGPDRARRPSPQADAIVAAFRERAGIRPRAIGEEEIVGRSLYPIVAEGAALLADGIAQRASDIDVLWVRGYGWPAATGGPMFWAEREGLGRIVEALERWRDAGGIAPPPLLVEAARAGRWPG